MKRRSHLWGEGEKSHPDWGWGVRGAGRRKPGRINCGWGWDWETAEAVKAQDEPESQSSPFLSQARPGQALGASQGP